ncbi:hypothetical protein GLOTRDRAFT_141255 [Gloeophyllum trabeum ATCC 11539]|uniref:Uncharacterized protein n=1 Tax=Gloeophyllum trabeum (strain ATCC 11539 / FP-39264 / Madison 617) TaxID=670483 RepID=S7PTP2_GLOTA|nr:uncharacterized protein GLOTRDRAFT_141255 [Gloeophyllum trabeum ATCC 11539]EPQ51151.1 hypothetical protein GLOTRDRAFT_141255 [Gloeophyllum trabeum ATCC 11539]
MVMAITKSASLNPSLEEGEVEEGNADSIASSREGSLTDEPLSPSDSTTTTSSGASKSKAIMHKAGARDGSAMSKSSSTTPTASSSSKPVQNSTSHSPPKPAPPENISAEREHPPLPPSSVPPPTRVCMGTVNAADLERAKTLVLDLLGWGVPPEYLVDAGVSGQVIYRVFTELNLRLPKNLAVPPQMQKQKT